MYKTFVISYQLLLLYLSTLFDNNIDLKLLPFYKSKI